MFYIRSIGNESLQYAISFVKRIANRYKELPWEEQIVNHNRLYGRNGKRCTTGRMTYTPQHIANYFLDRADSENVGMGPLKLLKLIYISYGWNLALRGEPLFNERIEAWQHGPVIPSIYHEFKHFGSGQISGRAVTVDYSETDLLGSAKFLTPHVPEYDKDTNVILDRVWESYRSYSGWQLRDMTHQSGTPWSRVYQHGIRGIQLDKEDIRQHYVEQIGKYVEAAKQRAAG